MQLGPQGLMVGPHMPELLRQAVRLLLDVQQVTGRGRRQHPLGRGQHQPSAPSLLLQEGWAQRGWALGAATQGPPSANGPQLLAKRWPMSRGPQMPPHTPLASSI